MTRPIPCGSIDVRMVTDPISKHPYFAERTKRGRPYLRRQRALRRLLEAGVTMYLTQEVTVKP